MNTTPRRFAHLHQHTQYSMLDGAAKLKDLLKWVKEVTPADPSCAMTDHGNMHGAVHFYNYARELGVKPIIGLEAYSVPGFGTRRDRRKAQDGGKANHHLTLLARDFEGYQNLCRLSSRSYTEGFYGKPRIDQELLTEHHKGLIVLSGCIGAEVPQLILQDRLDEALKQLEWYARTFKDRYYIEIQRHGHAHAQHAEEAELAQLQLKVNKELRNFAQKLGLPLVATNDGHYVHKEDAQAHDALLAIQMKKQLSDETRMRFACNEFYVKSPEELRELLPASEYGDEIFDNAANIASLCEEDYLPVGSKRQYQLPAIKPPQGRSVSQELRWKTYQGLMKRYPELSPEIWQELARAAFKTLGKEKGNSIIREMGKSPSETKDHMDFIARAFALEKEPEQKSETGTGTQISRESIKRIEADHREEMLLTRAEYELSVIERMGFSDYFLIVADYINWAKKQQITVGPARGSGAGSIVAYATQITELDPIEFKLLFERFLNPARRSMPDFDIDFHDRRRSEVVQYVREKYGTEHVGQITTFMGLSSRAVVKDVLRVMGVEYGKADKLTKLIPVKLGRAYSLQEAEKLSDVEEMLGDPELRQGWNMAKQLEGLTKASSVHAAGIVIGRQPLSELVPVMLDDTGQITTQYDMKAVEDIGLVKMDFLGLRTLTLIDEALRILKKRGTEIDINNIALDNKKTYEMIARGETLGVFQLEGDGITAYARQMRPQNIEDIIALSALYRPGPMEQIPTYIQRKHGKEEVSYKDFPGAEEKLSPILNETYGIPVYQEQIMQIASDVAGYSLADADLLRRAMGKKIREEMAKQREQFITGAQKKGLQGTSAAKIFALLEKFADYGFNRSHAAAYGVISYQTAYLKANHPLEFMAALLTVEQGNSEKLAQYIAEARRSGMEVLGPDINLPSCSFEIDEQNRIRFGLSAINGISEELVGHLLDEQTGHGKIRNLEELINRSLDHTEITRLRNRAVLENLSKAGALDSLCPPGQSKNQWRGTLLASCEHLSTLGQKASRSKQRAMKKQATPLFAVADQLNVEEVLKKAELSQLEMLKLEREALGIYISGHPLEQSPMVANLGTHQVAELQDQSSKKIILAGIIDTVEHKVTKSGKAMAFLSFSDTSGQMRVTCFNRSYENLRGKLITGVPLALICSVKDEGEGELLISLEEIMTEAEIEQLPKEVHLYLPAGNRKEQQQINKKLRASQGGQNTLPLIIHGWLEDKKTHFVTESSFSISEDNLKKIIENIPGGKIKKKPSSKAALKTKHLLTRRE